MEIKLPELGENIEGGNVLSIFVAPGDAVKKDDPILEIETDKATLEVPSPGDGVIEKVLAEVGKTVAVGTIIALLKEGTAPAAEKKVPDTQQKPAATAASTKTPSAGAQKATPVVESPSAPPPPADRAKAGRAKHETR